MQENRLVSFYLCVTGLKVSTGFFGNSKGLREERGRVGNIVTELLNDEVHLPDEDLTPNHIILPGSRLYTLTLIFPDATP
jgi:hypothetical protein